MSYVNQIDWNCGCMRMTEFDYRTHKNEQQAEVIAIKRIVIEDYKKYRRKNNG